MRRRVLLVLASALVMAAGSGLLTRFAASGQVTSYLTIAAPSFAGREYSDNNKAGNPACGTAVTLQNPGENVGDMDNGQGSFFANVDIPQGATVTQFRLFVNDADGDSDVFAYLYAKKIANNLSPQTKGQILMANTQSTGAVNATMRKFTDSSIAAATIDNQTNEYYVELVDCGLAEPFAVTIVYTTP